MEFALNLLVIPLIGGYWFMHRTHFTRFRAKGLSNYRLLLEAAMWGLFALIGSYSIARVLDALPCMEAPLKLWHKCVPYSHTGTALGAFALAVLAAPSVNLMYGEKASSTRTIIRYGDDLVRLLLEAQQSGSAVMLTLRSRKVYVGQVIASASLEPDMPFIIILPSLSGYRTESRLEVRWTTSYERIYAGIRRAIPDYRGLKLQDFFVVVRTADIQSGTPFRHHVHARHFALAAEDAPPGTAN